MSKKAIEHHTAGSGIESRWIRAPMYRQLTLERRRSDGRESAEDDPVSEMCVLHQYRTNMPGNVSVLTSQAGMLTCIPREWAVIFLLFRKRSGQLASLEETFRGIRWSVTVYARGIRMRPIRITSHDVTRVASLPLPPAPLLSGYALPIWFRLPHSTSRPIDFCFRLRGDSLSVPTYHLPVWPHVKDKTPLRIIGPLGEEDSPPPLLSPR